MASASDTSQSRKWNLDNFVVFGNKEANKKGIAQDATKDDFQLRLLKYIPVVSLAIFTTITTLAPQATTDTARTVVYAIAVGCSALVAFLQPLVKKKITKAVKDLADKAASTHADALEAVRAQNGRFTATQIAEKAIDAVKARENVDEALKEATTAIEGGNVFVISWSTLWHAFASLLALLAWALLSPPISELWFHTPEKWIFPLAQYIYFVHRAHAPIQKVPFCISSIHLFVI
mmetsp:Transcript_12175/g.19677  ORF Transcript_12175/g.19677 Transcript_12175/m.19677 type:complete len:234 (-) Transcript_12175:33-734(-)